MTRQHTDPLSRSALDALSSDLRLACMRIARRVRYESTSDVAPHQMSVLSRLEDAPRTLRELAAIENVSAPSMSRTTTGLVERGFVERTNDPSDGRQVILSLSADGKRALRDARRRRDLWMHVRINHLDADEQQTLARAAEILAKVAAE